MSRSDMKWPDNIHSFRLPSWHGYGTPSEYTPKEWFNAYPDKVTSVDLYPETPVHCTDEDIRQGKHRDSGGRMFSRQSKALPLTEVFK